MQCINDFELKSGSTTRRTDSSKTGIDHFFVNSSNEHDISVLENHLFLDLFSSLHIKTLTDKIDKFFRDLMFLKEKKTANEFQNHLFFL